MERKFFFFSSFLFIKYCILKSWTLVEVLVSRFNRIWLWSSEYGEIGFWMERGFTVFQSSTSGSISGGSLHKEGLIYGNGRFGVATGWAFFSPGDQLLENLVGNF